MHLGNAFSALLAWLSVRSAGGELVLRLEDLDPQRCKKEYCQQVEEDFRWLGLNWDRGGSAGGDEYYQSNRGELYREALHALEEKGLVYPCFCTRNQLHAASAPHRSDGTPIYAGTCRDLSPAERQERARLRPPALRVQVPEETISFVDGLQGPFSQNLARECGDFLIRRSDGVWAYQLAVVVDDALMGVTEVVRGEDLLDSTPRQLWLQEMLGYNHPSYCHVPLLYGADGHRLSKRQRDVDLGAIRAAGTAPEEVIGRLAHWAGLLERPEKVSAGELVSEFSWSRVSRQAVVVEEGVQ
jgi:glutamyl-tRNA synthetase